MVQQQKSDLDAMKLARANEVAIAELQGQSTARPAFARIWPFHLAPKAFSELTIIGDFVILWSSMDAIGSVQMELFSRIFAENGSFVSRYVLACGAVVIFV